MSTKWTFKDVELTGKSYKLSKLQAKAILELRLGRLTGLEQENLSNEFNDLIDKILSLQEILDKKDVLNELIAQVNEFKIILVMIEELT